MLFVAFHKSCVMSLNEVFIWSLYSLCYINLQRKDIKCMLLKLLTVDKKLHLCIFNLNYTFEQNCQTLIEAGQLKVWYWNITQQVAMTSYSIFFFKYLIRNLSNLCQQAEMRHIDVDFLLQLKKNSSKYE